MGAGVEQMNISKNVADEMGENRHLRLKKYIDSRQIE
jgi:hypothetical protein